ncbi:hypothetical protein O1L60_23915 [Streptomyces diastatochromogenes]|nr:hypothetical protein [Streptomyces diastatochromogenes]
MGEQSGRRLGHGPFGPGLAGVEDGGVDAAEDRGERLVREVRGLLAAAQQGDEAAGQGAAGVELAAGEGDQFVGGVVVVRGGELLHPLGRAHAVSPPPAERA